MVSGRISGRDESFYKSSPLGDEASTRSFGASLLTHTNGGKTFFAAHSMDVKFEGKGVARHIDLTTSNHASYPGSTPPFANTENMVLAVLEALEKDLCPCCGAPQHGTGAPMGRDDWYNDHLNKKALENNWSPATLRAQKRDYRALIRDDGTHRLYMRHADRGSPQAALRRLLRPPTG